MGKQRKASSWKHHFFFKLLFLPEIEVKRKLDLKEKSNHLFQNNGLTKWVHL